MDIAEIAVVAGHTFAGHSHQRINKLYHPQLSTHLLDTLITSMHRETTGIGVNRPGSFAEYIALPAFNVFKLMDGISDEQVVCIHHEVLF